MSSRPKYRERSHLSTTNKFRKVRKRLFSVAASMTKALYIALFFARSTGRVQISVNLCSWLLSGLGGPHGRPSRRGPCPSQRVTLIENLVYSPEARSRIFQARIRKLKSALASSPCPANAHRPNGQNLCRKGCRALGVVGAGHSAESIIGITQSAVLGFPRGIEALNAWLKRNAVVFFCAR